MLEVRQEGKYTRGCKNINHSARKGYEENCLINLMYGQYEHSDCDLAPLYLRTRKTTLIGLKELVWLRVTFRYYLVKHTQVHLARCAHRIEFIKENLTYIGENSPVAQWFLTQESTAGTLSINEAANIDVAHYIDGCAAAIQKPVDGKQNGDEL